MQAMKKLGMAEITELMTCSLPPDPNILGIHPGSLVLILWITGCRFTLEIFCTESGSPRYVHGKLEMLQPRILAIDRALALSCALARKYFSGS
jgi:hypothetical protein